MLQQSEFYALDEGRDGQMLVQICINKLAEGSSMCRKDVLSHRCTHLDPIRVMEFDCNRTWLTTLSRIADCLIVLNRRVFRSVIARRCSFLGGANKSMC